MSVHFSSYSLTGRIHIDKLSLIRLKSKLLALSHWKYNSFTPSIGQTSTSSKVQTHLLKERFQILILKPYIGTLGRVNLFFRRVKVCIHHNIVYNTSYVESE